MKNLLLMTDFIQLQKMSFRTDQKFRELVIRYANFLQQPLELWMFVPCGKDGQPLKIIPFKEHQQGSNFEFLQHYYYDIAKERSLIEGFTYDGIEHIDYKNYCINISVLPNLTFENLIKYDLKLTPAALIQFT